MTKLDKFMTYTPLKVFLWSIAIAFFLCILFSVIFPPSEEIRASNRSYLTSGQIVMAVSSIFSLVCSIFLYLTFLNRYKTVRDNIVLSFLTFYTPSVSLLSYIIIDFSGHESVSPSEYGYVLVSSLAFLVPTTFYFVRFRKLLQSGNIMDDFYIYVEDEYGHYDNK